jgi:hypothetical protein
MQVSPSIVFMYDSIADVVNHVKIISCVSIDKEIENEFDDRIVEYIFVFSNGNGIDNDILSKKINLIPKHYFVANLESVTIDPINCTKDFIKYKNNRIAIKQFIYFIR